MENLVLLLLWSATVTSLGLGMDQQDNIIILKELKLEKLLKKNNLFARKLLKKQLILEKKTQQ
jgi:hypothetical protein